MEVENALVINLSSRWVSRMTTEELAERRQKELVQELGAGRDASSSDVRVGGYGGLGSATPW
jgi:hypothetical protein